MLEQQGEKDRKFSGTEESQGFAATAFSCQLLTDLLPSKCVNDHPSSTTFDYTALGMMQMSTVKHIRYTQHGTLWKADQQLNKSTHLYNTAGWDAQSVVQQPVRSQNHAALASLQALISFIQIAACLMHVQEDNGKPNAPKSQHKLGTHCFS